MMIEAGVVVGYVVAWAVRKARRVGGHLDREVDGAIDANLDRLHEVVAAKLSGHPVLAQIVEEAEAVGDGGEVSDLTRQEAAAAIAKAAAKDDTFGQEVTDLVASLREAELAAGRPVIAGPGSMVFTGNAEAKASDSGIAIGQAGAVNIDRESGGRGPTHPARTSG